MGFFDSECRVSGLSLSDLGEIVCLPLRRDGDRFELGGEPVLAPSNRIGGIDAPDAPRPPFALVAEPIHRAIVAQAGSLGAWLAARGEALSPNVESGEQHHEGDVLARYVRARRKFREEPGVAAAIEACAAIEDAHVRMRLGADAPPLGWLDGRSWYGVQIGSERRASTTRHGLLADVLQITPYLFDSETLLLEKVAVAIAVVGGEPHVVELAPVMMVVNGPERARLDDTARAEAVFGAWHSGEDPTFEIDQPALFGSLPSLEEPLAVHGREVALGWERGRGPAWAGPPLGRLSPFAVVKRDGWVPPPR